MRRPRLLASRKGGASVDSDGEKVLVNGFEPDRNAAIQAQADAKWLREKLRASTEKEFPIRAVVLFPSWFVEPIPKGPSV